MKKKFNFLLLCVLLSGISFSEAKTKDRKSLLTQEWNYSKVNISNFGKGKTNIYKSIIFRFSEDSFFYRNGTNGAQISGKWKLSNDMTSISLFPAHPSHTKKNLNIIKLNSKELVLESNGKRSLFRAVADTAEVKSFAFSDFRGMLGIVALILIAVLISNDKRAIKWKIPIIGIALQLTFAFAVLRVEFIRSIFEGISTFFVHLLAFTREGALFLFGDLISRTDTFGFIFAFQVLPTVIFFSAFTSLLYYFGILQKVVWVFAWLMRKTMNLGGAESLSASANIFVGQTEAPLLIKPYINKMTRSEIMAVMTGGMGTIAGGVMAAYIGFLGGPDPEQQKIFATHLLTASIMNAPASLYLAKILIPEKEEFNKDLLLSKEVVGSNVLDAIARGTSDGVRLAVNVAAMLLVFTALIALVNFIFMNWIGRPTGFNDYILSASGGQYKGFTMQFILGVILSPLAWLMGVPTHDILTVGQLMGEKIILNEFYAYTSLASLKNALMITNEKSIIIITYALCGFANFASIGIQIGGISALAPNQRLTLSQLGVRAMIGGALAACISACIAGMVL